MDSALVRTALEIAAQAPVGGVVVKAHFIVVTDPGTRARLGELYRRAWDDRYGRLLDDARSSGRVPADLASAAHLAQVVGRVPVHVVACLDTAGRPLEDNQASAWGSVLPAAWSYMLAARAVGLAAAWTTVLLDSEAEVAGLLGLPDGVRIGALLPTAHPLGEDFGPARRDGWASHVHEERW